MECPTCQNEARRFGKDRKGNQRFQCLLCKKTFSEPKEKPLGSMTLAEDKALSVLHHLIEGCSIRSTERITGVHRDTILDLLLVVSEKCDKLFNERIQSVPVKNVQCDEIWGYVGMKERTKTRNARFDEDKLGDAYCFVAMERHTKLILTWHLGRRNFEDTWAFTKKLAKATSDDKFLVCTDGLSLYRDTIKHELGHKDIDFAQIIKIFGTPADGEARYSPPQVIDIEKHAIMGNPDMKMATTSHIERQNLTIRMSMRRMTRLTNAFSKKWMNLRAAYALQFAYYNFCRVHSTLRVTPAMEAGLTDHVWTLKELIQV